MTAAELAQLPDDGWRYELVEGELRKRPPPGYDHGVVTQRLSQRLGVYAEDNNLGVVCAAETGFLIGTNPDTVRAPDVAFVRAERAPALGQIKGYWTGAPDLVAEVISPSDTYSEVSKKAATWLTAGTRLVLIVDPGEHTVTVYSAPAGIRTLTVQDTLDGGDVVPGWTLPVRELFR